MTPPHPWQRWHGSTGRHSSHSQALQLEPLPASIFTAIFRSLLTHYPFVDKKLTTQNAKLAVQACLSVVGRSRLFRWAQFSEGRWIRSTLTRREWNPRLTSMTLPLGKETYRGWKFFPDDFSTLFTELPPYWSFVRQQQKIKIGAFHPIFRMWVCYSVYYPKIRILHCNTFQCGYW